MDIFRFKIFEKYPELVHGVSTAEIGDMSFLHGEPNIVKESRKKFFDILGITPEKITGLSLMHGTKIFDIERSEGNVMEPIDKDADILFTDKPETYLFFIIADCLGIFIYDPVKKVVSITHAGWRGVNKEAPKVTIQHYIEKYGSDPNDLIVGFSPAIQKESMNFLHTNDLTNEAWPKYIKENGNNTKQIDWIKFAYDQIVSEGVVPENIEISDINTRTDKNFFSHRESVEDHLPERRFGCLIGYKN